MCVAGSLLVQKTVIVQSGKSDFRNKNPSKQNKDKPQNFITNMVAWCLKNIFILCY